MKRIFEHTQTHTKSDYWHTNYNPTIITAHMCAPTARRIKNKNMQFDLLVPVNCLNVCVCLCVYNTITTTLHLNQNKTNKKKKMCSQGTH